MIIVRKNTAGDWEALTGIVTLQFTETQATLRGGGKIEVAPYQVETAPMDVGKISALLDEGVWGAAELEKYGLKLARPFEAPLGKRRAGAVRYLERGGEVYEEFDAEDLPPPLDPPSPERRLLDRLGVTRDELDELIAQSLARRGAKG